MLDCPQQNQSPRETTVTSCMWEEALTSDAALHAKKKWLAGKSVLWANTTVADAAMLMTTLH